MDLSPAYALLGRYQIRSRWAGWFGNMGGGSSWLKDSVDAFPKEWEAKLSGEVRWADEE